MRRATSLIFAFAALCASASVVDSSVIGGKSDTFAALLAPVPDDLIDSDVAAEDTPGSTNWYARIDSFRVPCGWRVTSNGVTVADAQEPTLITVNTSKRFGDLNIGLVTPDWTTNAYFFGQFDARWNGNGTFRAFATNYTDFSCSDNYGEPLYWMKSHKLDKGLYGSFFASYNAYFERLFYGSLSDQDSMEGRAPDAVLDPRHHFVRSATAPTNTCHRLLEYPVITNFLHHVKSMRENLYVDIPPGGYFGAHPSFVNPNEFAHLYCFGLLRNSTEKYAHLYWASTRLPPIVDQNVGGNVERTPKESDMETLMPTFGWREDAIAHLDQSGNWVQSQFWQCHSITLDALLHHGDNPIQELFNAVGVTQEAGPLNKVRSYDCGNFIDYFMNAYKSAGRECPNRDVAEAKYIKCFKDEDPGRNIRPDMFVGANQTLAVMDRLIYVPATSGDFYNEQRSYYNSGTYSSENELEVSVSWDDETRTFFIDGTSGSTTFEAHLCGDETRKDYIGDFPSDWMILQVGPVTGGIIGGEIPSGYVEGIISLVEGCADDMFEESSSDEYFDIFGAWGDGTDLVLHYAPDWDLESTAFEKYLSGVASRQATLSFYPSANALLTYDVTVPSTTSWGFSSDLNLPTTVYTPIVHDNKVAFLDRRELTFSINGNGSYTNNEYKCDGEHAVNSYYSSALDEHALELIAEMKKDAKDRIGKTFSDPEEFADLPSKITMKLKPGTEWIQEPGGWAEPTLPFVHNHEEPAYACALPYVEWETLVQTNVIVTTNHNDYTAYYGVLEIRTETVEGFVLTEATTNFLNATDITDYLIEAGTNSSAAVAVESSTNTAYVIFLKRDKDKVQFDYILDSRTNTVNCMTNVTVNHHTDNFSTTNVTVYLNDMRTHTNVTHHADGSAETNFVNYARAETNVTSQTVKYEYTFSDLNVDFDGTEIVTNITLTGQEVISLSTNVEEIVEITECPVSWRIYRDHKYEALYEDPYGSTNLVWISGYLPIPVGIFGTAVHADDDDLCDFAETLQNFSGFYSNKVKFSPIESVNFTWKSMMRSDIEGSGNNSASPLKSSNQKPPIKKPEDR